MHTYISAFAKTQEIYKIIYLMIQASKGYFAKSTCANVPKNQTSKHSKGDYWVLIFVQYNRGHLKKRPFDALII